MAGRYYKVGPVFWSDNPHWNDDARLCALYILTSPHRTLEGLFRMPTAYAVADLGWSAERFAEPFAQLLADGFIEYDATAAVCLIVNALKWQGPQNPNQVKAALDVLAALPRTPLLARLLALADAHCERLAEGLRERFGERLAESPAPAPPPSPTPPQPPAGGPGAEPSLAERRAHTAADRDAEQRIFDAWVAATGRTAQTEFDDARRRAIRKGLRVKGYTWAPGAEAARRAAVDACLEAVSGVGVSAHHMERKQWSELRVVLRDAGQIEHFQELGRTGGRRRAPRAADYRSTYGSDDGE